MNKGYTEPLLNPDTRKLADDLLPGKKHGENEHNINKDLFEDLPLEIYHYIRSYNDLYTNIQLENTSTFNYGKRPFPRLFDNTWQRAHSAAQLCVPYGYEIKHPCCKSNDRDENYSIFPYLNRYNKVDRIDLTKPKDMFISVRSSLSQSVEFKMHEEKYCLDAICSMIFNIFSILKSCISCFPCITVQACYCCYGAMAGLKIDCQAIKGKLVKKKYMMTKNQEFKTRYEGGPPLQVMEDEKIIFDPITFYYLYTPGIYKIEPYKPKNNYESIYIIAKNASKVDSKNPQPFGNWYLEFPLYLAQCYRNGHWVIQDPYKAFYWYKLVIARIDLFKKNNVRIENMERELQAAYHYIAVSYETGNGVLQNDVAALAYYRKAAMRGYALSQYALGFRYENGKGVVRNEQKAVDQYREAASHGLSVAQYNLGRCYEYNIGVVKDEKQAFEWYLKAADQKDASAQYSLGLYYERGKIVKKNLARARFFHEKAAKQGNELAAQALKKLSGSR